MDHVSAEGRSRIMRGIRGKNTKPERIVRSYLHATGLRFRLHARSLPGRPDIVLPSRKTVVFVHGCFWHQHPRCVRARMPLTRSEYWRRKFWRNRLRDKASISRLWKAGWRVEVIWECEIDDSNLAALAERLHSTLPGASMTKRPSNRDSTRYRVTKATRRTKEIERPARPGAPRKAASRTPPSP